MIRLLLVLLACAVGPGCVGPVKGLYPVAPGEVPRVLHVFNNHWHTGFAVPTADLPADLRAGLGRLEAYPFVEIGWGDQGFYRARAVTSGMALEAMFCSRGTVLLVVGLDEEPRRHYREFDVELYRIELSGEGYRRVLRAVAGTFARDGAGNVLPLEPGLYGDGRFFAGRGRYGLLATCNNWTARTLRAGGFPITPAWAMLAVNFDDQVRLFGGRYQRDIVVQRSTIDRVIVRDDRGRERVDATVRRRW
ncbi:MAG TPA: DUF2459 domain-containing protein [Tepidisphaeraceae bacterium]|nr:DUF2459 domain-containing protein [Tepidisphaeraceae bacterium]